MHAFPTSLGQLATMTFAALATGGIHAAQLAVLKLDDLSVANGNVPERWQRVIRHAEERGIRTSIGIIGNSLEGDNPAYLAEIRRLAGTGLFEFWHHGYDHKRWEENGKTVCEFAGTDDEHQLRHFRLTQNLAKQKLGITFRTFGAPFNATDETTADVLSASPDIRVWLQGDPGHAAGKFVAVMVDGVNIEKPVHKPNYDAFAKGYEARDGNHPPVYILQGHPNSWDEEAFEEFTRILEFLEARGIRYALPAELPESLK